MQKLCEISNALWKRDMDLRPERDRILQSTETAMVSSLCGVKLVDKKLTKDLAQMLDFNETTD